MKKILLAFDGRQFSEAAFELAKKLNEMEPILLTGVFLPEVSYASMWDYANVMSGPVYAPIVSGELTSVLDKNIKKFQLLCLRNNIEFRVHKDLHDFALPELKRESRFADLMILSSEKFFANDISGEETEYIHKAISDAECPVLVVPENFVFPTRNIIAYDGGASSVYAMKQFAYLFPSLAKNETLLVHANEQDDQELPDQEYITELASQHYPRLSLLKLKLSPKKYFTTWLADTESSLLITGAYGRTALSKLFKKSFTTNIIADHKLPVFIAHQ